jgi:signal transduction histidine kinase
VDEFLKNVALFQSLPDEAFARLLGFVEEIHLDDGETLLVEGAVEDRMFVLKQGRLEVYKMSEGRAVTLNRLEPGEVIGELSLLEHKPHMASARATGESVVLSVRQEAFEDILNNSPRAARTLLDIVLQRLRATEAAVQQSAKLTQLGTLTAGIAHELNNPASAVERASMRLQDSLDHFAEAQVIFSQVPLTPEQQQLSEAMKEQTRFVVENPVILSALARSDRESEFEDWLEAHGIETPWQYAPHLVNLDLDVARLEVLIADFGADKFARFTDWICSTYDGYSLLNEIRHGVGHIVEIVSALKSYSYLDQAPLLPVDIHKGLESTLVILRSQLKHGITLNREYAPDLPIIQAYGVELNQVWTNIIHNACDAMNGQGIITIRTRSENNGVVVEIEDNGPGIPEDIQGRIFDPFFTTKEPGHGTGIGLNISYNIIVYKHKGSITVDSQPGRTVFSVWLPMNPA